MANKRFPALRARARRAVRAPVVGTAVRAHPRLLHGFLVPLGKVPTFVPGRTLGKGIPIAIGRAHAGRPAEATNEGPSDDATFH